MFFVIIYILKDALSRTKTTSLKAGARYNFQYDVVYKINFSVSSNTFAQTGRAKRNTMRLIRRMQLFFLSKYSN